MVQEIQRNSRSRDPRVVAALEQVPRHLFVPQVEVEAAYSDRAIPTHWQDGLPISSASQPSIVATMLELLDPQPGNSVLEIGTGTGYNAALLAELVGAAGRVVSVEIQADIASEATEHLAGLGLANVEVVCADGFEGYAASSPYERIIVTAGASDLAPAWVEQLAHGARLVLPLSIRGIQQCVAFVKEDEVTLRSMAAREGGFMPLQGEMVNLDSLLALPAQPGAFVGSAPDVEVDLDMLFEALLRPGPLRPLGLRADFGQLFGSLRRWLAYNERRVVTLTYIGQPYEPATSPVPRLLDFAMPNAMQWFTVAVLDHSGFAALDQTDGIGPDGSISLALRGFGSGEAAVRTLQDLVHSWDAARRPEAGDLRISAYMGTVSPPAAAGFVQEAKHARFVVSW